MQSPVYIIREYNLQKLLLKYVRVVEVEQESADEGHGHDRNESDKGVGILPASLTECLWNHRGEERD